ncbi:hypothetical protein HXX76_014621, partial [Chlamydomonas incerta]
YLAVTADYDDSSPATRAASLNEQRQRAARAAALASARKPPAIAPLAGDSVTNTPRDVGEDAGGGGGGGGGRRSLAKQVTKHREAAAAAAAGGGGGPGNLSARSFRARAAPSVAALLDDVLAADEGALPSPRPGRKGGAGAAGASAADAGAEAGDSSDDELGGEHGGGGGPGGPEPPPTVYLPADPRQWAADVVRENEAQAVWDADKKLALEQALKAFDAAVANQRAAARERAAAEAEAKATGRPVERPGRHVLDSDTTAVEVGEGGDIPGGLLLVVDRRHRTPGTAVVHDREIEEGEMQYNRGLVLLALGRLAEAAADLDAALAANPHHAHYPYYQAVVCARRGQDDEAIAWDNLALQRNPAYFHALYHLGLVLHLRGEHTEAIQRLDAAAGLQPRDWRVMEARGRVLQNLDRHNEAVPALRDALAAVAADGDQPPAVAARLHFALAQSAVAAHQPNLLRESLRLARLHGQDPASVANLRGCLARKERQFDSALRHLSRAVAASPGDARFYYDRAQGPAG